MTPHERSVIHGRGIQEWRTCPDLYARLDLEFDFLLDVCATEENALADDFFTRENSCLDQPWIAYPEGNHALTAFMNPPYGNKEVECKPGCKKLHKRRDGEHVAAGDGFPGVEAFIHRAWWASQAWGWTVACLLFSNTDTRWWHDYVPLADEVRLWPGRVRFLLPDGTPPNAGAPKGSCLVIFRPHVGPTGHRGGPRFVHGPMPGRPPKK